MMARSPYALVFCDTSFFYASLDRRDRDHLVAKSLVEWVEDHQVPMMTTWEVVVETVTLLRYRFNYQGHLTQNGTLTCMSWVTEHQIVIPVKTGIQTKGLPDLGSCFRRNDDKNELRSCA